MKYQVLYGDSPWKITVKFTGNGLRWPELIRANPSKPVEGFPASFASLEVGERLNLPEDWRASIEELAAPLAASDAPPAARRKIVEVRTPEPEEDSGVAWSTPSWEEP